MPIVNFHLIENTNQPEHEKVLLEQAAKLYAEILKSPVERVRAYITYHTDTQFYVGGDLFCNNQKNAPYFEFIVLEGRPLEERQRLLLGFTELLVDILGVDRKLVRGQCRRVDPEDWAIGGVPASNMRKDEIDARRLATKP